MSYFQELADLSTAGRPAANIYLTGLMGAGKTTVGRFLSHALGALFYDTDEIIVAAEGMSINEIFTRKGEPYFRDQETELLRKLAATAPGSAVISTGGGMVIRKENRALMRRNGLIVYLHVPAKEAFRRLSGTGDRPLLNPAGDGAILEELLEKRKPFYQDADLVINTAGKPPPKIASEIKEAVKVWKK